METFYQDPSMFFETFPRVFYIETTSKNGAKEILTKLESNDEVWDFAVDTLSKNGGYEI